MGFVEKTGVGTRRPCHQKDFGTRLGVGIAADIAADIAAGIVVGTGAAAAVGCCLRAGLRKGPYGLQAGSCYSQKYWGRLAGMASGFAIG